MRFRIQHTTTYSFSREVFLEPHAVRMQPRNDGAQWQNAYNLSVTPEPQSSCKELDAEGNLITHCWFAGVTDRLRLVSEAEITTLRQNPFDYLLTPANSELPVHYPRDIQPLLLLARQRAAIPQRSDPVRELAEELLRSSDRKATRFLMTLCSRIQDGFSHIRRETGEPWPPEQTFERQSGSCRDLAWLYVDACRAVGLAARFVSGYQVAEELEQRTELHAWSEVLIPGAGWRGFDPTLGVAVSNQHIALAASVLPACAAPVTGTFRGSSASSELSYDIEIQTRETTDSSAATEEPNVV